MCCTSREKTPRSFRLKNVVEIADRQKTTQIRQPHTERLLCSRFAMIIARGNLRPFRGPNYVPVSGSCFRTGRKWSASGARPHIVEREVDDESWRGLSAGRAW